FFDYNSVRQIDRKRHNLESLVPENIVFKIEEYPQIFSMHSSIWAGLYKKSFLIKEKIKFPTTKSASYQDFYFNTLVLMKANIVITYEHFLHYRQEFGHLSSIARKDKMLLMFIEQFKNVYHVIKDYYNYKNIESYFFNSGFRTCYHFYNQIMDAYKIIFFNQLAEVVQNFKGIDTTILNEHSLKFYKRLNRKNCAKNYDIKVS
ncbi:TPA: hypothetical protein RZK56_001592, partial [Campylobacter coli]|nr:hypothetical protein [Campylobacter coli]